MDRPLVLVDADNLDRARLAVVSQALSAADADVVVAGTASSLRRAAWPAGAHVVEASGWQGSDVALAVAYEERRDGGARTSRSAPADAVGRRLVLVTGDGDFVHLAARHPGPVLVVGARSARAGRYADHAATTDPAVDGAAVLARWLAPAGPA